VLRYSWYQLHIDPLSVVSATIFSQHSDNVATAPAPTGSSVQARHKESGFANVFTKVNAETPATFDHDSPVPTIPSKYNVPSPNAEVG